MKREILIAEWSDVEHIALNLRAADVLELSLAGFTDPAKAVRNSFTKSDWSKVVRVDGVPTVLFGCGSEENIDQGVPWMLATEGIAAINHWFVRRSVNERDRMLRDHRRVHNLVHVGNDLSIRWLRWLGFEIGAEAMGPGGQFRYFWMERADV